MARLLYFIKVPRPFGKTEYYIVEWSTVIDQAVGVRKVNKEEWEKELEKYVDHMYEVYRKEGVEITKDQLRKMSVKKGRIVKQNGKNYIIWRERVTVLFP